MLPRRPSKTSTVGTSHRNGSPAGGAALARTLTEGLLRECRTTVSPRPAAIPDPYRGLHRTRIPRLYAIHDLSDREHGLRQPVQADRDRSSDHVRGDRQLHQAFQRQAMGRPLLGRGPAQHGVFPRTVPGPEPDRAAARGVVDATRTAIQRGVPNDSVYASHAVDRDRRIHLAAHAQPFMGHREGLARRITSRRFFPALVRTRELGPDRAVTHLGVAIRWDSHDALPHQPDLNPRRPY